ARAFPVRPGPGSIHRCRPQGRSIHRCRPQGLPAPWRRRWPAELQSGCALLPFRRPPPHLFPTSLLSPSSHYLHALYCNNYGGSCLIHYWHGGLSPTTLPADTVNVLYIPQTITASGGTGAITLAVSNLTNAIAGLAPPTSGNGSLTISGTPASAGTETFTVTATDSLGAQASANYSITVNPAVSLSPTSPTLAADTVSAPYSQ